MAEIESVSLVRTIMKRPGIILIVFIVVALFLLQGTHGLQFSGYSSQWELKADVVAIGTRVGPPTATASGGYLHIPTTNEYIKKFGGTLSSAIWDFDASNWGQPDVRVTLGGVREEVSKLSEPTWTKSGFHYVTEMHEYLVDVEIRTVATVEKQANDIWFHETAMPHTWATNFGNGGTEIGKHAAGYVYVRFANSPWGLMDFGPAPTGYKWTETYWFGIMEAALEKKSGGDVPSSGAVEHNYEGYSKDVTSGQAFFNMVLDDGTFVKAYAKIPYGDINKILDPDIQQAIIVALPYDMLPGADDQFSWTANGLNGAITGLQAIDEYVTYTVRMTCVVVKESVEIRDPVVNPVARPIELPKDYYTGYLPSWWDQWGLWIIIGGIVACILLVAAGFLSLPLIGLLMGGK